MKHFLKYDMHLIRISSNLVDDVAKCGNTLNLERVIIYIFQVLPEPSNGCETINYHLEDVSQMAISNYPSHLVIISNETVNFLF